MQDSGQILCEWPGLCIAAQNILLVRLPFFWLREGLIVRCEVRNLLGRCANPCESLCLAPPHAAAVSQCRKFVLLLLHECRFCFFECNVAQVSGLLVSLPGRGSARTFGLRRRGDVFVGTACVRRRSSKLCCWDVW